jgi:hypothetical protein
MNMPDQAMQVTILRTLGGLGRSLVLSHADQVVNRDLETDDWTDVGMREQRKSGLCYLRLCNERS